MQDDKHFHFRIRVGEIEIEASGPEEYVNGIRAYAEQLVSTSFARLKTMGAMSPPRESPSVPSEPVRPTVPPGQPLGKDESLVEFLERLPNKTHQEKILAFGYFLEKNRDTVSFGVKEINDCYDEVKDAKSNTAQYFALLVKSGLIMRAKVQPTGGPTQYVLTRKGERAIEEALLPRQET
jgi:hypothetical protein